MKKIIKTLTTAAFLIIIPLSGIMVKNHDNSQDIELTMNHQEQTNDKQIDRQDGEEPIEEPVTMELTTLGNPEGITDLGVIFLNLDIKQTKLKQVTEVDITINDEESINIYDGGFGDEPELNLSYLFTGLTNGVYVIEATIN